MVPVATETELRVLVRKLRNYIRVFANDGTARCGICSVCGQTHKEADRAGAVRIGPETPEVAGRASL